MNINVHYTTQLRAALGQSQQSVSVEEGATLAHLLQQLKGVHPEAFAKLVVDGHGNLLPNIILCVGDQQVTDPQSYVLQEGANVTLLSAISGG